MSKISISYEQVKLRHPAAIKEIVGRIAKSKSKSAGTPLKDCNWRYSWGMKIKILPFDQLAEQNELPVQEQMKIEEAKVHVLLEATAGHGRWATVLKHVPPEISLILLEGIEADIAETQRLAAMSAEEAEAEVEQNLTELSKSPGFAIFRRPDEE